MAITLINLTKDRLVITNKNVDRYCQQKIIEAYCHDSQSTPFQGVNVGTYGQLYLDPYRTAIWRSQQSNVADGDFAWNGTFIVQPQPYDWCVPPVPLWPPYNCLPQSAPYSSPWGVTVHLVWADAHGIRNSGKGTWIYLQANVLNNWSNDWNTFSEYGIWVVPNFLDPPYPMENVMTLSGPAYTVSMYTGAVGNKDVTLVFRENCDMVVFPTCSAIDDYKGWPLGFVDNTSDSVP